MANVRAIFENMADRYIPGGTTDPVTFYFSVGSEKWTVTLHSDRCEVNEGRKTDSANCVLKCDPGLFEKMVLHGKAPGPLDIARGKIKTNDPSLLVMLQSRFRRP